MYYHKQESSTTPRIILIFKCRALNQIFMSVLNYIIHVYDKCLSQHFNFGTSYLR